MSKYTIIELPENFEKGDCDKCPIASGSFLCCPLKYTISTECPIEIFEKKD